MGSNYPHQQTDQNHMAYIRLKVRVCRPLLTRPWVTCQKWYTIKRVHWTILQQHVTTKH